MSNTDRNEIEFEIKQLTWALSFEWPNNKESNTRRRRYFMRLQILKNLLA